MARYYLAYGSNMSRAQMTNRCATAQPVTAVLVRGWALTFRGSWSKTWGKGGVASLEPQVTAAAPAALYELDAAAERRMDSFEGVDRLDPARGAYRKVEDFAQYIEPVGEFRLPVDAVVFVYLCNHTTVSPPAEKYLETIRLGYHDWDFSEEPATGSAVAEDSPPPAA